MRNLWQRFASKALVVFVATIPALADFREEAQSASCEESVEVDAVTLLQLGIPSVGVHIRTSRSGSPLSERQHEDESSPSPAPLPRRIFSAYEASNFYATSRGRRLSQAYDSIQIPDNPNAICTSTRDMTKPWVSVNSNDVSYFFFSHHKCGTALFSQIMAMMAQVLGLPCEKISYHKVHNAGAGCSHARIALYEDTTPESLALIQEECPNMRAVHLYREAFAASASNFVYTYHLHMGSPEIVGDILRGQKLRSMPLNEAVATECEVDEHSYLPQLASSYVKIAHDANPNILQIRYEDCMDDFNGTMQMIFSHFLGENHSAIDDLVDGASAFDLSLQPEEELAKNKHVTSSEEKANVTDILAAMYWNASSCAQLMASNDGLMGYPLPDAIYGAYKG